MPHVPRQPDAGLRRLWRDILSELLPDPLPSRFCHPMSLARPLLSLLALPLRRHRHPARANPNAPRILVIRRNRLGDMLYTVPLLHTLRRHYPYAWIAVACDLSGVPIARACEAVNEVIPIEQRGNRWLALWKSAAQLQNHDWSSPPRVDLIAASLFLPA